VTRRIIADPGPIATECGMCGAAWTEDHRCPRDWRGWAMFVGIIVTSVALAVVLHTAAKASDWRPQPADRLAALDAEMAPLLVQYQPAFDAIVADFGVLSAPYRFEGVAAATTAMQERLDAAERLPVDIAYALSLAHDALAILDRHPPEACWSQYHAVMTTAWLLYGDGAHHLELGLMTEANGYVGAALQLLGPYGTLIRDQAGKDCA
jgi:hypothetical protein